MKGHVFLFNSVKAAKEVACTLKNSTCLAVIAVLVTFSVQLKMSTSSYAQSTINVSVDWGRKTGATATGLNYGLNAFQYLDPNIAGNPGSSSYKANVSYMKTGILRLHKLGQMDDSSSDSGWVISPKTADYKWDVNKITNALNGAYSNTPVLMINIANWPAYMDDGKGRLKPEMYSAYAQFCAELVKIVNQLGKHIVYWEVTNEKDVVYGNDMDTLGNIFNQVYNAMRAVDSTIKIGGPAVANPYNTTGIDAFLQITKSKIDFVSYHTYSPGNSKNEQWNSASELGYPTTMIKGNLQQIIPSRAAQIATFHDEFNMERTGTTAAWLTDSTSLIYDALAIRSTLNAGVTGAMGWNEGDGWFGKLNNDSNWTKRPAAHLYKILNEHALGSVVSSNNNGSAVEVFATDNSVSAHKDVVLINRSQADQTVSVSFQNWGNATPSDTTLVGVYEAGPNGYSAKSFNHASITGGFNLPADTVAVLEYGGTDASTSVPTSSPTPDPNQSTSALNRSGWIATASSNAGGSQLPDNALDGSKESRWSTGINQQNGQYFQVDMGSTQTFSQIVLDAATSNNDYPRKYDVYVSNDGLNWSSPVASGSSSSAVTTVTFPTQSDRYIKIIQTGSVSYWWWSIHDFNVYR